MDTIDLGSDKDKQARRVKAARELHQPSVLCAGEYEDGTCAFCTDGGSLAGQAPTSRFRDYLNGARTKTWMHAHPDMYPTCVTCAGFASYDLSFANWPCATATALGWADGAYAE